MRGSLAAKVARPMRVLVFHGYLLRGTGSNVYNARLCAALARAGHSVDLLCQEPRPEELDFVDAVGRLGRRRGARSTTLREPVARDRLAPGHRPPAARLRRRPLRGHRGAHAARSCSDAEIEAYVAGQRRRRARRRARARGPTWRSPTTSSWGPAIVARGAGRRRALRGQGPRQRAGVRRQARPGALPAVGARGPGAAPARCSSARATPASRCGRRCRTTACPGAPAWGRPGVDVDEFRPRDDAGRGASRP